jgi:hypothetical protein
VRIRLAAGVAALVVATAGARAVAQPAGTPGAPAPPFWADAYITPPRDQRIIPRPKALRWREESFEIMADTRIVVGDLAQDEDLYAARDLNEELAAWGRPPLEIVRASAASADPANVILIGEPGLNALAAAALARTGLRVDAQTPGPEGYVLAVSSRLIVASGSDRRGTFYAIQTLRQLLEVEGDRLVFRGAEVRDWPDHPVRAVHVVLDNYSDVFHAALIDRIFARYKFNMLIAESEYVQWDSAPAIRHPGGATKAQAAAVIAAARRHLIEPVPLIQTLGHSEWLFTNGQNLDLLEMPADLAPARYAYDPLNPRVYEVLLPILDEALDLFKPRFLHIGHDEVRNVVPFPWSEEGRRLGFGELYARDVLRLYSHLRGRGVGTMMWADVVLSADYQPEWSRLPRDIVMVDWQYQDAARYPSLSRLREMGFPVLGASWFHPGNNASLSLAARRAGAMGMVRTTWTGYFNNRAALAAFEQMYSYIVAAEHFWNATAQAPALGATEAARRFAADWEGRRDRPRTVAGFPVDLRGVANRSHVDDGDGWLGKGPAYDFRNLPTGPQRLAGVRFDLIDPAANRGRSIVMLRGAGPALERFPDRVTVVVRRRAGSLCVLHALPYPARSGALVATYRVYFDDGASADIPVRYRRAIGTWLDGPLSIEHEIAWSGSARSGLDVRLSMLCWTNPDPRRAVMTIEAIAGDADAAPAIFAITALDGPRR